MKPFVIGIIAGTLSTISFLPQLVKIFKTKNAKDLSLITFSIFSLGVLLWLVYGILIREIPIIIANGLTLIFVLAIVVMKIRYR